MTTDAFPPFIQALEPVKGTTGRQRAWKMAGDALVIFYEDPDGSSSEEHAHCDEWGVILQGTMEITVAGETTRYGPGDAYFVPEGTLHATRNHPGLVAIDVFGDPAFA